MENEQVRVLEMNQNAGKTDVTDSHPSETVYFVKGGKVKIHLSNGEVMEADIPNGHLMWHEERTHRVENVGTTDIQAIIVESKQ